MRIELQNNEIKNLSVKFHVYGVMEMLEIRLIMRSNYHFAKNKIFN